MKKTILDSLKSRKFRFGGYATLLVVAALAIVVGVNLVVDQIPAKLDMTQERLYSLSDQTKKLLDGLDVDVTITTLGRVGSRGQAGEGGARQDGRPQPAHPARDRRPRDQPRLGEDLQRDRRPARGQPRGGRLRDEVQDHRPVRPVQLPDEPADVRERDHEPRGRAAAGLGAAVRHRGEARHRLRGEGLRRREPRGLRPLRGRHGPELRREGPGPDRRGQRPRGRRRGAARQPPAGPLGRRRRPPARVPRGRRPDAGAARPGAARRAHAAARGAARQLRPRPAAPARGRGRLQPVRVPPAVLPAAEVRVPRHRRARCRARTCPC